MIGSYSIGSHGLPETLLRDPPNVTFTGPTGTIASSTVTVTWTYSSAISRPQLWFRVRLLTDDGSLLYDSMLVESAATSHAVPTSLSGFATYLAEVTASDGNDSDMDSGDFFVEVADVTSTPVEQAVGSIYEVAINGTGFMLADHPDKDINYKKQSGSLEAPRFATGSTPFSEAIDRYTFLGHDDWSGGAGQRYRNLDDSDPSKYFDSENVDPFTLPGSLQLIHQVKQESSLAYATPKAVVAGTTVYIASSTTQLTAIATPGGSETQFTAIGAAGSGTWLASDGSRWYWSNGTNIRRNSSAADPGSNWSAVAVTEIGWVGDRLAGLDTAATPPNFTTFADDGTEEVPGGRFSFPTATLRGLAGGDGYAWFGVNRGVTSEVRAWKLGSTDSSFVALNLPAGESIDSMFFYLGNVFIATSVEGHSRLYRCIPQEGKLTPEQFLTQDVGHNVTWTGYDRFVAFTWKNMTTTSSGIGLFDLSTGGYAKWYQLGTTDAPVAVVRWANYFGFTASTKGFWSPADTPVLCTTGFLITSTEDLSSGLVKTWDGVGLTTQPLAVGHSIAVAWAANGSTFQTIDTLTSSGGTSATFPIAKQSRTITLKLTLNTSAATSPILEHVQVRLHPVTPIDQQLVLPLRCADKVNGLNNGNLPTNKPGRSIELKALVESWVGGRVQVQDIDWPVTKTALTYDVVGVQVVSLSGVFDNSKNRRSDDYVAQISLRRGI